MAGMMGPAVLVTIGLLFLIQNFSDRLDFGDLWPLLLIVIGIVKVLQYTAPADGHIPVGYMPGQVMPPPMAPPVSTVPPQSGTSDQGASNV
jgi:hypothetical protein